MRSSTCTPLPPPITPPSLSDLFWGECGFSRLGGISLWYSVSDLFAQQGGNNWVVDIIFINIDFYKYSLRT